MKLSWNEYKDYDTAKDCQNCLYVFRKGKKPIYIGKAKQFGGAKGRYAYGYRYLVEALLESGCKLYIAVLDSKAAKNIDDYERSLIKKYRKHLVNKKYQKPKREINNLELSWRVSNNAAQQGRAKKRRAR